MEWLPDQRNSRTTALLMLLISIILIYVLFFHWFILRHNEYALELDDLRVALTRFQTVAAQRETLQANLSKINSSQNDADLFLTEPGFDEAAAAMSSRIGQLVSAEASDACQIVSRQPVRPRVQERFEKVTVNARMRCDAEDFLKVLYGMETGVPLMLVSELNIIRPRARRRSRAAETESQGTLDIRFNVSGYLK